jgi:hypothetical protein
VCSICKVCSHRTTSFFKKCYPTSRWIASNFSPSHPPFYSWIWRGCFVFFSFVIWCLSCRTTCELISLLSTWFFHLKVFFFPNFQNLHIFLYWCHLNLLLLYQILFIYFFPLSKFIRASCLFQRLSNGRYQCHSNQEDWVVNALLGWWLPKLESWFETGFRTDCSFWFLIFPVLSDTAARCGFAHWVATL